MKFFVQKSDGNYEIRIHRQHVKLAVGEHGARVFEPLSNEEWASVRKGVMLDIPMSIRTHCDVSKIDDSKTGKERYTRLGSASVTRHTKDTANKFLAEVKALAKGLGIAWAGHDKLVRSIVAAFSAGEIDDSAVLEVKDCSEHGCHCHE